MPDQIGSAVQSSLQMGTTSNTPEELSRARKLIYRQERPYCEIEEILQALGMPVTADG